MEFKRLAFLVSGAALFLSLLFPYLFIIFTSPQYPTRSPKMYLYSNSLKGDLNDWRVVGRYIGVDVEPPLPEFDKNTITYVIALLGIAMLLAAFAGDSIKRGASILLLAAGLAFAGWGQYRMYQQGHNLDPRAPMRMVVKPFTPPLLGWTTVGKIRIYHLPHVGFILFGAATCLTLLVAWRRQD
jgi:copper chaperone NosL